MKKFKVIYQEIREVRTEVEANNYDDAEKIVKQAVKDRALRPEVINKVCYID